MKHLFLSGRRMEDISSIHALFQSNENKDALYYELLRKYEEDVLDLVREAVEEGHNDIVDVFLCNVREVYEINPLQLSDIHFIGLGQPTVRLDCTYRESIDLSLLRLSFEGVKLDSSAQCFLVNSDGRLQNCRLSETIQTDVGGR